MNDVIQSGFIESPLGYDNVDWFVDEARKVENKKTFFFKKINQKYYVDWTKWKTL